MAVFLAETATGSVAMRGSLVTMHTASSSLVTMRAASASLITMRTADVTSSELLRYADFDGVARHITLRRRSAVTPIDGGADKARKGTRRERKLRVAAAATAAALADSPPSASAARALRLVVLSDTHGFETQLPPTLPDGDVLVHAGDWWGADCKLDEYLAAQPHPHKLVIRGNHDPHKADFSRSGAIYATTAATAEACGVRFSLVPYTRKPVKYVPECDVLVTHEPPHRVRDRCLRGTHVGSASLRSAVERMPAKPRLWLCGHIHEASGAAERVRFGGGRGRGAPAPSTLVCNAANANDGYATRLVTVPTVIDLVDDEEPVDDMT